MGRSHGTRSRGSWVTAVSNPFPAQPWHHAGGKRDVLLLQAGRPQLGKCSGQRGSALGRGTCHRQPTEQLAGLRRGMRASLTVPGRRAPTAPHAAGLLPTVQAAGFSPGSSGTVQVAVHPSNSWSASLGHRLGSQSTESWRAPLVAPEVREEAVRTGASTAPLPAAHTQPSPFWWTREHASRAQNV